MELSRINKVSIIKFFLSLFLILLISIKVNWAEVWSIAKTSNLEILAFVLILKGFGVLISAYRWLILLRVQGIERSIHKLHIYYYIGFFFNNFLPTTIGGDVVRIYKASAGTKEMMRVTASVVAERILGLGALLTLAAVGLLLNISSIKMSRIIEVRFGFVAVIAALISLGSFVYISQKINLARFRVFRLIQNKISNLISQLSNYKNVPSAISAGFVYSLLFQFLIVVNNFLLGRSIRESPNILGLLFIVPTIMLVSMIPISINGIGLKEAAYVSLFPLIGIRPEAALVIAVLSRFFDIILSLIGGLLNLIDGAKRAAIDTTIRNIEYYDQK
jgi:uncharacterized protein (TIRG00374 family)